MENLIILDYSNASVHLYNVGPEANIDEEYISSLGFHTSNCAWMFGQGIKVTRHKGTLL